MTWMPTGDIRMWLRHPIRMFNFAFGCCPVCNSSPPNSNCFVCQGSYEYGPRLTPGLQDKWLVRYKEWLTR